VGEVKNPEEDNVFALHKLFSKEELPLLEKRYKSGEIGYQESKEILSDNIIKMIAPMREKREKITDEEINRVLNEGGKKALKIVLPKLLEIRKITGLL
jgi:tryptophanyl-tRNA synthetase